MITAVGQRHCSCIGIGTRMYRQAINFLPPTFHKSPLERKLTYQYSFSVYFQAYA